MIDAGHFWAQNADDMTAQNIFFLETVLNSSQTKLEEVNERVNIGQLYVAKFTGDKKYYRCKVVHIKPGTGTVNVSTGFNNKLGTLKVYSSCCFFSVSLI